MANNLAVNVLDLAAAVPFYGRQPDSNDVPKIKAALQLHYAEMDERVNAGIAAYEEALKKAGTQYSLFMYPGAQHAFHREVLLAEKLSRESGRRLAQAIDLVFGLVF